VRESARSGGRGDDCSPPIEGDGVLELGDRELRAARLGEAEGKPTYQGRGSIGELPRDLRQLLRGRPVGEKYGSAWLPDRLRRSPGYPRPLGSRTPPPPVRS
jgi:hypothetical protein